MSYDVITRFGYKCLRSEISSQLLKNCISTGGTFILSHPVEVVNELPDEEFPSEYYACADADHATFGRLCCLAYLSSLLLLNAYFSA